MWHTCSSLGGWSDVYTDHFLEEVLSGALQWESPLAHLQASEPCRAIFTASSVHLTFSSQISPSTVSTQASTWGTRDSPSGLRVPSGRRHCPTLHIHPASLDLWCEYKQPTRLLTPPQPAIFRADAPCGKSSYPTHTGRGTEMPRWDLSGGLAWSGSPWASLCFLWVCLGNQRISQWDFTQHLWCLKRLSLQASLRPQHCDRGI